MPSIVLKKIRRKYCVGRLGGGEIHVEKVVSCPAPHALPLARPITTNSQIPKFPNSSNPPGELCCYVDFVLRRPRKGWLVHGDWA